MSNTRTVLWTLLGVVVTLLAVIVGAFAYLRATSN